jgi:hypothetical protein
MSNKRIVGVAHVGTKPSPPTEPHTMVFNFHNFANLTENNYTSPSILCHGYHWKLCLYPNGDGDENIGFVSFYLQCRDTLEGTVESILSTIHSPGKQPPGEHHKKCTLFLFEQDNRYW